MVGQPTGEAEVWLVTLPLSATALDRLDIRHRLLAPSEQAAAFGGAQLRSERRLIRIALRLLLASRQGPAAVAGVEFCRMPAGRPFLAVDGAPRFSVSHSGGNALIALAGDGPIGVDLECHRPIAMPPQRLAALIRAGAAVGPASDPPPSPIVAWTRLEAIGKAGGTGVGPVLERLGLRGDRTDGEVIACARDLLADLGATVHDLAPLPGWPAAIAMGCGSEPPAVRPLPDDEAQLEALLAGQR
jgi:4'-phosphopantetheinyl transferase